MNRRNFFAALFGAFLVNKIRPKIEKSLEDKRWMINNVVMHEWFEADRSLWKQMAIQSRQSERELTAKLNL